tara:strand:+ start:730 stop:1137 length:408 start_codon:yes stop_codon:yes gene_type:complete
MNDLLGKYGLFVEYENLAELCQILQETFQEFYEAAFDVDIPPEVVQGTMLAIIDQQIAQRCGQYKDKFEALMARDFPDSTVLPYDQALLIQAQGQVSSALSDINDEMFAEDDAFSDMLGNLDLDSGIDPDVDVLH